MATALRESLIVIIILLSSSSTSLFLGNINYAILIAIFCDNYKYLIRMILFVLFLSAVQLVRFFLQKKNQSCLLIVFTLK